MPTYAQHFNLKCFNRFALLLTRFMLTLLSKCLALLPLPIIHQLGSALGWLLHWCTPNVAKLQRSNLLQSGLCSTEAQLQKPYATILRKPEKRFWKPWPFGNGHNAKY